MIIDRGYGSYGSIASVFKNAISKVGSAAQGAAVPASIWGSGSKGGAPAWVPSACNCGTQVTGSARPRPVPSNIASIFTRSVTSNAQPENARAAMARVMADKTALMSRSGFQGFGHEGAVYDNGPGQGLDPFDYNYDEDADQEGWDDDNYPDYAGLHSLGRFDLQRNNNYGSFGANESYCDSAYPRGVNAKQDYYNDRCKISKLLWASPNTVLGKAQRGLPSSGIMGAIATAVTGGVKNVLPGAVKPPVGGKTGITGPSSTGIMSSPYFIPVALAAVAGVAFFSMKKSRR